MAAGGIGAVILGFVQDNSIDTHLKASAPALHARYATLEKSSIFGDYRALDGDKLANTNEEDRATITTFNRKPRRRPCARFLFFL